MWFSWMIWMWSALCGAHPMSSQLHGHQLEVYLQGSQVELHYAAEVPTNTYLRQLRSAPEFAEFEGERAQEAFDQTFVQDLEWGFRLLCNGQRLAWERVPPEGPVFKMDSNFAVYQLWLRAVLPEGARTLNVVNANMPDEPAYFSNRVFATSEISIEASSLLEVDQGSVIKSRSGEWLMDENQREIRLSFQVEEAQASTGFREVVELGKPGGERADETPLSVISEVESDPLLSMVTGELTPGLVLLSIGLAIVLGAAHALAPGHGKALVAAYLLGSRRNIGHAVWLGIIVTLTHTAGVYVLALVAWLAEESFPPEQIMPWLELLSGFMILGLGLVLVRGRMGDLKSKSALASHPHGHAQHHHGHEEMDEEAHAAHHAQQLGEASTGWRELVTMGVAGGLTPCPSALILLLAAISFHRLAFGLVLVAFFSLGLALVVMAVGIAVIKLGDRVSDGGRLRQLVPSIALGSAVIVTVLGAWMSWKGAMEVW